MYGLTCVQLSATTPRRVYAANLYYTILLSGMVKIGQEGTQGEVGRPIMLTYFSGRGGGGGVASRLKDGPKA